MSLSLIKLIVEKRDKLFNQVRISERKKLHSIILPGYEEYSLVGQIDLDEVNIAGAINKIVKGLFEEDSNKEQIQKSIALLNQLCIFNHIFVKEWFYSERSEEFPLMREYILILEYLRVTCANYLYEKVETIDDI